MLHKYSHTAKIITAIIAVIAILSGCTNDDATKVQHRFRLKVGDKATYRNYWLNPDNTPFANWREVRRTVVAKDVSIGGYNDAYRVVDSIFNGGALQVVDTLHFRMGADGIYHHNFGRYLARMITFSTQRAASVSRSSWTCISFLKPIAANSTVSGDPVYLNVEGYGEVELAITLQGKGVQADQSSFAEPHAAFAVQGSAKGIAKGTTFDFPIEFYTGGVNSENSQALSSPEAIVRFICPSLTIGGENINGYTYRLTSFTPGQ